MDKKKEFCAYAFIYLHWGHLARYKALSHAVSHGPHHNLHLTGANITSLIFLMRKPRLSPKATTACNGPGELDGLPAKSLFM